MDLLNSQDDAHDSVMSTGFFSFSKPEKQGWLTKQGGRVKNWKRRWFVLKDNRMYYYKSPKDGNPLGFIPLDRCAMRIVENSHKKFCFEIFDPHQPFSRYHPSFFIYADTQEEMTDWINRLNLKVWLSLIHLIHKGEVEVHTDSEPMDPVEKEGWLLKQGGMVKNWKKRWFKLQGNYLYYYKHKTDKEPLGFIPIDRASINVLDPKQFKRKYAFEIRDPSNSFNKWHKSYFVCAESDDEMKEWINKIVNITFTYTTTPDTMTPDRSRNNTHTLESVVSYLKTNSTINNNNDKPATRVQKSESSVTLAEMMSVPQAVVNIVAFLDVNKLNAFDLMRYYEVPENSPSQEEINAITESLSNNLPLDMETLEECSDYVAVSMMLFDYLAKLFLENPVISEQTAEQLRNDFESSKGESQIKAMKSTISQSMNTMNQTRLKYFIAFLGRIKDRNELSKFDQSGTSNGKGIPLQRSNSEDKNSRTFQQTSTLFARFLFPYLFGSNGRPIDESQVSVYQDILRTMLKNYDTLLLGSLENC